VLLFEFLTAGKVPPIEIHKTNDSRLWWSLCWCEYSKMLGKAVEEAALKVIDGGIFLFLFH